MIEQTIAKLTFLCDTVPNLLSAIKDEVFSEKHNPSAWSKKEIMGHLIDSATINHHRIVRGQFEADPVITYDQNKWNQFGFYQDIPSQQIISFWKMYNLQLIELIQRIPPESLNRTVHTGGESGVTLEFLISDYVAHLEHHLKQVLPQKVFNL